MRLQPGEIHLARGLRGKMAGVQKACIDCGRCLRECAFLRRYGTPRRRISEGDAEDPDFLLTAYECSLCGLCDTVCREGVEPKTLFLEMRRASVKKGLAPLKHHARVLDYERRGTSKRYTFYSLPGGCRTVLFPGCTFAGTRSRQTQLLYAHLKTREPDLGMVLDCCSKPSHDLGCQELFTERFEEMKAYLLHSGIRRVIVVCPNCYKVFSEYGSPLETISVYELLLQNGLTFGRTISVSGPVTVHDPCVLRQETGIHQAVRKICHAMGLEIAEMLHSGERTLCCGEGGSAGLYAPGLAAAWRERRKEQAGESRVITYCAGCASALKHSVPVTHILDAVLYPDSVMAGRPPVSAPPFTYLHRLWLKRLLKRKYPDVHMHERQERRHRRRPDAVPHRLEQARRGLLKKLAGIAGYRKR